MSLTYVSASVEAKGGCEKQLEKALAGVVGEVRAEDGCIRYDLHKSEKGDVFYFYEIWESSAHLDAHLAAPHMDALRDATAELVAGPPEVNTWGAVDVAD